MEASLNPYPGFCQAIGLLILLFLLNILISIVDWLLSEVLQVFGVNLFSNVFLKETIISTISVILILLFGLNKSNRPFKEVFPLNSFNPFLLLPLLVFLVGFNILQSEFKNIWERYIGLMDFGLSEFIKEIESGSALSFLVLTIVVPFKEEFLFRGLIFQGFTIRYNPKKAVFLSSILFAAGHVTPFRLINSFIIGLFLAWLFLKTESLWPCIVTHTIGNGLVYFKFIAEPVFSVRIPGYTLGYEYHFHPMWFNAIGVLFFISGGMLLFWSLRRNGNEPFQDANFRLLGQIDEQDLLP